MIKIEHVSKSYKDVKALDDVSLILPEKGLVIINGPSGGGKTTLLNAIFGLIDFEGRILINNDNLKTFKENDKDEYRLRNFGFVFQDFKLFENDNVINNVVFPLELRQKLDHKILMKKGEDILEYFGLKDKAKQIVATLSGGEKQRVAIARALINSPKVILADEPTGSLDEKNSFEIMDYLYAISKTSLVVMVSHDETIAKLYGDIVIKICDGKIDSVIKNTVKKEKKKIGFLKPGQAKNKSTLSLSFILRHCFISFKTRKIRTLICTIITSLGLIGVGLSVSLSSLLSNNMKKIYSSIIEDNKIMITQKEKATPTNNLYFGSYYQALDLQMSYKDLINDVGICYYNDFENFFPHQNEMRLIKNNHIIDGFTARNINDYVWVDDSQETFYPEKPQVLEDDEIAVALTFENVKDICYQLNIPRTVNSLSNYLAKEKLDIYFHFRNDNWEYDDEQTFRVKAFTLSYTNGIYHTNHLWNVKVFEENMRFPTVDNLINLAHPYDLRKIPYFKTKSVENLIKEGRFNEDFSNFSLEIATSKYYPILYKDSKSYESERVLLFINKQEEISPSLLNYIFNSSKNIKNPILGSSKGIAIYPEYLMMGFSSYIYFCCDMDLLDLCVDATTKYLIDEQEMLQVPDGVKLGHYSRSAADGVSFALIEDQTVIGRKPQNLFEITLSSALYKALTKKSTFEQCELHIAYVKNEKLIQNNVVIREFERVTLNVVGVVDSKTNTIYHERSWPLCFFQYILGNSIFDLGVNDICVSLKNKDLIDNTIKEIEKSFPTFKVLNPLKDVNEGVDQTCEYIKIGLFCFSLVSTITSIILLTLCNYLFILEHKKDIGLSRVIGVNNKESQKFIKGYTYLMCGSSFLVSCFEIIVISVALTFILSKSLSINAVFTFNPLSLLLMFGLAFGIAFVSSFLMSYSQRKIKPLDLLNN